MNRYVVVVDQTGMRGLIPVLQLLVACASVFNVIRFRLDNLLIERTAELDRLILAGLAVAAMSTAAVLVLCWRVTALTRLSHLTESVCRV